MEGLKTKKEFEQAGITAGDIIACTPLTNLIVAVVVIEMLEDGFIGLYPMSKEKTQQNYTCGWKIIGKTNLKL